MANVGLDRALFALVMMACVACGPSTPPAPATGSPSSTSSAAAPVASSASAAPTPMDQIAMIDPSATGSAADILAARFPNPDRERMTRAFAAFSKGHSDSEREFGVPPHDPGCAITTFIVGGLMASSGIEVPLEQYKALQTQLRRGLAVHPEIVIALHLDRGSVPEQFEILGEMMIGYSGNSYAQRRELVSAVAKRYVQRYLGFDLGDIELTDAGLHWVRGTPSGPLAVLVQR